VGNDPTNSAPSSGLRRAELTIPREQLLISVADHHRKWYLQEAAIPIGQLIVQPADRGTAPAVLHSILSIAQLDKNALAAFCPPTTTISINHSLPMRWSQPSSAHQIYWARSRLCGNSVWMGRVGRTPPPRDELFGIRAFREKPSLELARNLMLGLNSIWNTFVMVGRVKAFLAMLHAALPGLSTARSWRFRTRFGDLQVRLHAGVDSGMAAHEWGTESGECAK